MQEHPSRQILERLLAETLSDTDRTDVESHLENCSQCQTTLHELTVEDAGGDSSVSLKSPSGSIPAPINAESEEFFRRLKRIPAPGESLAADRSNGGQSEHANQIQIEGYEIIEEVGRGAFGVVYRARDRKLNRLIALKLIHAGPRLPPEARQRFMAEAMTIARLKHPNIIQIYAVGEHAGCPFLSLELVDGGNLAVWMNGKPQPVLDCIRIVSSLAQAIDYAHRNGVVHRDLKPANVLFIAVADEAGKREIKITDFGIAKVLPEPGITQAGMTQTNEILGTPAYMAPEQANGKASQIGPATDVYSIGAIFYELLTGRPPFQGANTLDTLMQALWQDPVPVRLLVPRVPRDVETICLKCLQKDPQRRYLTAAALADDLRRFEKGEPIMARPVGIAERAMKWIRRHPAIVVSVTAAMLTVLILICTAFGMLSQRASTIAAVEEDLRGAIASQQKSEWQQARDTLDRATLRLAGHDYGDLRHRLELASRNSELASRFDAIWLDLQKHKDAADATELASRGFEDAFHNAGLGTLQEPAPEVAVRVRDSNIRTDIVAALDNWSTCAAEAPQRKWVLDVARASDIDPDGCLLTPLPDDQLKTVTALLNRALNSDVAKDLPHLRSALWVEALAEYRAGHYLSAGSIMIDPLETVPGPTQIVLAMAEFGLRKVTQARHTLARAVDGFDWSATDDQQRQVFHVLRREAEAMMLPNLASFLRGEYQPGNNDERLALTAVCQFENRPGQLARLWSDAFAADQSLAPSHRYAAACAAALAGCGRGIDTAYFNDADRAHFRDQARQWLAADLDSCQEQMQRGEKDRQEAEHTLSNWFKSPDLACVRDSNALEKLPAAERKQWTDLWQKVRDLVGRAADNDTPSKDPPAGL